MWDVPPRAVLFYAIMNESASVCPTVPANPSFSSSLTHAASPLHPPYLSSLIIYELSCLAFVRHFCRATFPGAGRVTGHWTGDNAANWDGLFESVASMLAPNMWGIAMSGADICGFLDENVYAADGKKLAKLSAEEYQQLCNR